MAEHQAEPAHAKINLYLHVTSRRGDGYHLLDSLVVFAGVADLVSAAPADDLSLSITGPMGFGLAAGPDNLAWRAAGMLAQEAGIPARARLRLEKHLPLASGIGGGSADAAATLRALARLWALSIGTDDLARLALRLGADVPVCLRGQPARMQGIGEILRPAPKLAPAWMVLVNPGTEVSTPDVFKARAASGASFSPAPDLPAGWDDADAMAHALRGLSNDLEMPAIALCPAIDVVLAAIAGTPACLLARMSGSGATCFGLYASAGQAEAAATTLRRPGWWVWHGPMLG